MCLPSNYVYVCTTWVSHLPGCVAVPLSPGYGQAHSLIALKQIAMETPWRGSSTILLTLTMNPNSCCAVHSQSRHYTLLATPKLLTK
ncbi:hypothetical protein F5Y09DRAFT_295071 [Xylaria sp. FL1042]|nr:hypothetical protein F5Y09DRAFT_295071 [Xylaria sp. FL1042]